MDSQLYYDQEVDKNQGNDPNMNISKAQDLHYMLDVILEDYIKLQNTGFLWDLFYRNKWYNDVEFVLFTPFLKLDGDEAEKLCGKYTSRTACVQCLCRYCVEATKLLLDHLQLLEYVAIMIRS